MKFFRFNRGTPMEGPANVFQLLQISVTEEDLASVVRMTEVREIDISPELFLEYRVVRRNICTKRGEIYSTTSILIAGVVWYRPTLTPFVFRQEFPWNGSPPTLRDELTLVSTPLSEILIANLSWSGKSKEYQLVPQLKGDS